MKKYYYPLPLFFLLLSLCFSAKAQNQDRLLSPKEFLGYDLGTYFTFHHQMVAYVRHVAQFSKKVQLTEYGKTYEGRPLIAAFISSEENIKNLEQIRKNNLIAAGFLNESSTGKQLPIVWLSYNIHGNEASSLEAAMMMLYNMVSLETTDVKNWLNEMVIVIDPCENPDGRDRYANWYRQKQGVILNTSPESWDHQEPWPGGRFNHYLFDLNRDWLWQTQQETRQRIAFYQSYLPHVHVDLHEMGYNSPYFFAPAAKPYHKEITEWQRTFQKYIGENHASYFKRNNQLFYTKEVFDLFYPSYGDTYPTFNGSVGFTYEQGGGGRAGLKITTQTGNDLTLYQRLYNHYTTSYSTVETAFKNKEQLLKEFNNYFKSRTTGDYAAYIIKYKNQEKKAEALRQLLESHRIVCGNPSSSGGKLSGYDYMNNQDGSFSLEKEDIVVNADQAQSRLIKIIFERQSILEDSLTYDATSWALPYVYNAEVYAVKTKVAIAENTQAQFSPMQVPDSLNAPYSYLATWKDASDARFLAALLKENFVVRYNELPFKMGDQLYERGTLIINRPDNFKKGASFDQKLIGIANSMKKELIPVNTGLVNEGKDFGSGSMVVIQKPRVGLIGGEGVSPTQQGELWHHFEEDLKYPIAVLPAENLSIEDLKGYTTLLLPQGNYSENLGKTILDFVKQGGKAIAVGSDPVNFFAKTEGTQLHKQKVLYDGEHSPEKDSSNSKKLLIRYEDSERLQVSKGISGAIFKITLDESNPLAFGYKKHLYVLKNEADVFPYLPKDGWNAGIFTDKAHTSGFVGYKVQNKIKNTLALGIEHQGSGTIVYMTDSPIFRGFWHGGKLLLGNAIFFAN